jgi:predicted  nucleic acid-binding Zn-ribbon protein
MEQKGNNTSLNELRNESVNINDEAVFEKAFFGGYNKKAVSEYIKLLKEDLRNAESLFNQRLDEYAAMVSMLTQERDKYLKIVNENENINFKIQENIELLKKENEGLIEKNKELSENALDQSEIEMYIKMLSENDVMKNKIVEFESKLAEYENEKIELNNNIIQLEETISNLNNDIKNNSQDIVIREQLENEIKTLKNQISQLELNIEDLNSQIAEYSKNEVLREEYETLVAENDIIKQHYDDLMTEKSIILAEKNILLEQNKRISDNLIQSDEKIKELREINTKIKLKTRKVMAEFETKIYECSQNHQKNIELITDNITNALNILNYESMDIQKLIGVNDEQFFIEDENIH